MDDYRPELPPEPGKTTRAGFEPDDQWLKVAEPEFAKEAMRLWFATRYWDPANDTPYNGQEGGYLYIHGGPFDADEELYGRFGDQLSDDIIRAVIDDVESDGITEWAPIHTEPDYDSDFELPSKQRSDPHFLFQQRLSESDALIAGAVDVTLKPLMRTLVYSYLIAALEAYLVDTVSYWVATDDMVLRRFVSNCEEFKQQKLSLSQIFERMDALRQDVEKFLQQLVWHRLDKIAPLLAHSFAIDPPDIGVLMSQILVRHDIVHRGGKTKRGKTVIICSEELSEVRRNVTAFVDGLEAQLKVKFPDFSNDF